MNFFSKLKLSEHVVELRILLPLLKDFRYGDCCEVVRREQLEMALKDFYDILGIGYKQEIDVYQHYDDVKKIILYNNSLPDDVKVQLYSLL